MKIAFFIYFLSFACLIKYLIKKRILFLQKGTVCLFQRVRDHCSIPTFSLDVSLVMYAAECGTFFDVLWMYFTSCKSSQFLHIFVDCVLSTFLHRFEIFFLNPNQKKELPVFIYVIFAFLLSCLVSSNRNTDVWFLFLNTGDGSGWEEKPVLCY